MAALYKAHLKELAPDTIMLYVIPSDFLRPPSVRLTGDSLAYPLKRPKLALPVAVSMMRLFAHHRWGVGLARDAGCRRCPGRSAGGGVCSAEPASHR